MLKIKIMMKIAQLIRNKGGLGDEVV